MPSRPRPFYHYTQVDSNDLLRRIAHATGATFSGEDEYHSSYTGDNWGRAVGGTLGAAATAAAVKFVGKHRGFLAGIVLISMGTAAASLLAQALGRALAHPAGVVVGYVVMVTVSGIVAAVAVNSMGEPVEFINLEDIY